MTNTFKWQISAGQKKDNTIMGVLNFVYDKAIYSDGKTETSPGELLNIPFEMSADCQTFKYFENGSNKYIYIYVFVISRSFFCKTNLFC